MNEIVSSEQTSKVSILNTSKVSAKALILETREDAVNSVQTPSFQINAPNNPLKKKPSEMVIHKSSNSINLLQNYTAEKEDD